MNTITKLAMFFSMLRKLGNTEATGPDIICCILLLFIIALIIVAIVVFILGVCSRTRKERFWFISSSIGCILLVAILHIVNTRMYDRVELERTNRASLEQEHPIKKDEPNPFDMLNKGGIDQGLSYQSKEDLTANNRSKSGTVQQNTAQSDKVAPLYDSSRQSIDTIGGLEGQKVENNASESNAIDKTKP